MGFKTTNYEIPELGLTLPSAYAVVKGLQVNGKVGEAVFAIQQNRDDAFDKEPLKTVRIYFTVNREENIMTTAYNKAKEIVEGEEVLNEETGEYEKQVLKMPFSDWEDDLVDTTSV